MFYCRFFTTPTGSAIEIRREHVPVVFVHSFLSGILPRFHRFPFIRVQSQTCDERTEDLLLCTYGQFTSINCWKEFRLFCEQIESRSYKIGSLFDIQGVKILSDQAVLIFQVAKYTVKEILI